jgi:hypothetical protein
MSSGMAEEMLHLGNVKKGIFSEMEEEQRNCFVAPSPVRANESS